MSQSVERLKQLLFDSEAQALGELTRRIASVAETELRTRDELGRKIDTNAAIEAGAREDLRIKIDEIYARTGDAERMTASVSEIISAALRRAEVAGHLELSQSIAPLVVTTIKTELRNSQDEMVEALYPITGRLVKSYVASAIKDLTEQMNRRLEQNPVMLRLQSLTTGRSVGELALAGTQDFEVKELYLIRRGSGELVAHWPERSTSGRDHAMSGVLAAVNEFANEAFSADEASLRQIDLGDEEVYLRGSPIYLLAARCSGHAPKAIEQTLDDAFLTAVETQHRIDADAALPADRSGAKAAALASVGTTLQSELAAQLATIRRPASSGPLKMLAAIIVLPVLGWFAWGAFTEARVAAVRATAERVIAADPDMTGYPAQIDVTDRGKSLAVSGLTPSLQAKNRIVADLTRRLPAVTLRDRLNVVAGSGIVIPDVTPQLARVRQDLQQDIASTVTDAARATLGRTNARAEWRLKQAAADLVRAGQSSTDAAQADALKHSAAEADAVVAALKPLSGRTETSGASLAAYDALSHRLDGLASDILRSTAGDDLSVTAPKPIPTLQSPSLAAASEQLAANAERVAALASTSAVAKSLRPPPPVVLPAPTPPPAPVVEFPKPSPRDQLETWTRSHAIFFASNLDYRNPETAARMLDELAQLIKNAGVLVRIAGYTDEAGAQQRNATLAQDRAEKIRGALLALGVQPALLAAVGRANASDLSDTRGPLSPNRRVQFELGFEGEVQQ
jgi:outer membrane protein OmpA-like peptidoglycan-associated protein